jgi:hypothetical protein
VYDPPEVNYERLLIDWGSRWEGNWLAGSLPEWSGFSYHTYQALHQPRYLSNSGRLFFNSDQPLVPQATNDTEDVYEYEPEGVPKGSHECTPANPGFNAGARGCIGLISSGSSTSESAFLDASESGGEGENGEELSEGGGDVFFVTAAKLVPQDTEGAFTVYDAHECTGTETERCANPGQVYSPASCETSETCRPFSYKAPGGVGGGATTSGDGNLIAHNEVAAAKSTPKPITETRAQKLAQALKRCRSRYRHARTKRRTCEMQAHKRYPPRKKTKTTKLAPKRTRRR